MKIGYILEHLTESSDKDSFKTLVIYLATTHSDQQEKQNVGVGEEPSFQRMPFIKIQLE